jgi:hypothetical protein
MPQAGVSVRTRRRSAAPWSDELDRDAFRFPTAYEVKRAERTVTRTVAKGMAAPATPAPVAAPAPVPAPPAATSEPRVADGGRRTVVIRGHGAERNLPVARPTLRRHERPGFKADRAALWAVMLGLLLILVAAASAHAAVLH